MLLFSDYASYSRVIDVPNVHGSTTYIGKWDMGYARGRFCWPSNTLLSRRVPGTGPLPMGLTISNWPEPPPQLQICQDFLLPAVYGGSLSTGVESSPDLWHVKVLNS